MYRFASIFAGCAAAGKAAEIAAARLRERGIVLAPEGGFRIEFSLCAAMPENGLHFSEGFAMAHEDYAEGGCKYAPRCRFCKEKCKETPPMLEVEGHQVRCWLYTGKEGECHASDNGKAL